MTLDTVDILPGYWRVLPDSDIIFSCEESSQFCIGGNGSGDLLCKIGHVGPWCRNCQEGFITDASGPCEKCERDKGHELMVYSISAAILFTLVTAYCILRVMCATRVAELHEDHDFRRQHAVEVHDTNRLGKRPANKGTIVKLTMIFLQILSSMSEVLSLDFPSPFSELLQFFKWPTLSISVGSLPSFGCHPAVQPSFYSLLVFITLGPLLVMGYLGIRFARHVKKYRAAGRFQFELQYLFSEFIFIMFIVQPTCSRYAFQTFSCTDRMDDDKRWLLADLELECDTPGYTAMLTYAVLMVFIWPIGVSLFFYIMLVQNLYRIKGDHLDHSRFKSESVKLAVRALSTHINQYLKYHGSLEDFFAKYDQNGRNTLSMDDFIRLLASLAVPRDHWW